MWSSLWCRHQHYLGKVKHATFQTQGAGRKRVIVATEQNVLASLNLRRGEICKNFIFKPWRYHTYLSGLNWLFLICYITAVWKHVLGDLDPIDGLEIVLGKCKTFCLILLKNQWWWLIFDHFIYSADVVTVSKKGSIIRAWNLPDGHLMWETFLQSPGIQPILHVSSVIESAQSFCYCADIILTIKICWLNFSPF